MSNIRKITALSLLIIIMSTSGCRLFSELSALTKCEFRQVSVDNVQVSGVALNDKQAFSDINLFDVAKMTTYFASKKFPLNLTFNIESRNPGTKKAAIRKFEWVAMIDDVQIATSTVTKRVEIMPNESSIIPINLSCDLREVFSKESMKSLINLGLNIAGAGDEPSRLSLKIKPTIMIGTAEFAYPGYITLDKEFKTK